MAGRILTVPDNTSDWVSGHSSVYMGGAGAGGAFRGGAASAAAPYGWITYNRTIHATTDWVLSSDQQWM